MDKSTKKQRYSLRKTQMGVGSVLLATVLLTAGTVKAEDGVLGLGEGLGLTNRIQGKSDPDISSIGQGGGEHQKQGPGLGLGLNKDGKTQISSLAGPSGSGHGGNHLGLTLGLGGGAYIYGNGEHSEVEEPKLHVPEKGRTPEPDKKPEVDQETLEETPKPQPQTQPQSQPAPKSQPEETPKAEALKQGAPKKEEKPSSSGHSNSNSGTQATYRLFAKVEGKGAEEIDKDKIKSKDDRDRAEKKVIEDNKEKYPYVDRIEKGNDLVLLFSEYKTNIVLRTVNSDDDKREIQYSFYKKEADLKAHLEEVKKGWADNYDVEQKEEIGEDKVKTVTLIFTKKGLKPEVTPQPEKPQDDKKPSEPSTPEVTPQPEKPSTPEVAPKPGEKPSVPSKPEVAPKPDDKPSIPEPEKLEMDKSMKVVPGKPKKATPEAQVPEAQVPQVPQVQVPQTQAPQLPSPKEEVAKVQQQPRAIQSSAPAKSGGKQLPNTGEAASILTLVGSGMLGLLGLAFTKKRKTK
ncbi:YSIRK-type signal peptide-containing protein [Streptococcus ruminantium]|uniref:YSIRK-type signal peptide-containing protein n=1 Tax=Streptococcus ruminantium TaxID=1917441 RepID=UPI0012DC6128|nr:YSIRK-type signal peptide-containing protein [Streptococcus ruminantium]